MSFKFLTNPAFYDIFGMIIFAFITGLFIWALYTKRKIPVWARRIMLGIGIAGLITDIFMVYFNFIA